VPALAVAALGSRYDLSAGGCRIRGAAATSHVRRVPACRHRGRCRGHRAGGLAALGRAGPGDQGPAGLADHRGQPDRAGQVVVGRLMAAMSAGDMDAVVALLHPDVTFTGDSDGKAPTAVRTIRGRDKLVRFMLGLARRYGPAFFSAQQLARVNGELGAYIAGT